MTDFRSLHREAWFWLATLGVTFVVVAAFVLWPFVPLSTLAIVAAVIRGALCMLTASAAIIVPMSRPRRGGLMGAAVGMFMTTQSLLIPETPWDAWATIVASSGWLLFIASSFGPEVWNTIAKIGQKP